MAVHRSPVRRQTVRSTGNKVSGEGTGSTCKIESSTRFLPDTDGVIGLKFSIPHAEGRALFLRDVAIVGSGGYLRSEGECEIEGRLTWTQDEGNPAQTKHFSVKIGAGSWQRFGTVAEVPTQHPSHTFRDIELELTIHGRESVDLYGVVVGTLNHDYFAKTDVYKTFAQNLKMYVPETLYLDPTVAAVLPAVIRGTNAGGGGALVCKSCNRCSRFLPIDVESERNALGYSNHCNTRAPCGHGAFSKFSIVSGDATPFADHESDGKITTYYGFQLECRACKKFFVNAPLNPERTETQHREDALRRRAFEALIAELLNCRSIYHTHRVATGKEFDHHIWERFGRKCFKCKSSIPSAKGKYMQLDHTMPLAFLYPMDDTATCLCPRCNGMKSDKFPTDFYTDAELVELHKITGLSLEQLRSRDINRTAADAILANVVWLLDTFLANDDYQKVREGKKASDNILHSLHAALRASGYDVDLVSLYEQATGSLPTTVTVA